MVRRALRAAAGVAVVALALSGCRAETNVPIDPLDAPPPEQPADERGTDEAREPLGPDDDDAELRPDEVDPAPVASPALEQPPSEEFPDWGGDPAMLVGARLIVHDGLDRLVLEFDGEVPTWQVRPIDGPIIERPGGAVVELPGTALLEVRLVPATSLDLRAADPTEGYTGPTVLEGDADGGVLEAVLTTDQSGMLVWSLALDAERAYAVAALEDPSRLVVDVITD
jgi:hypothetical protein